MRVNPTQSHAGALASERSEAPAREVAPQKTVLSPSEIRKALADGHQALHKERIPPKMLDVLSAQVCHETGRGASMYNYNFGGIKGTSREGSTARLRTREVLDGKEVQIKDGFRAYSSAASGASDYLLFLEKHHPRALEAARQGDVEGFVKSLKAGHYFTADADQYAASVRGILTQGFDGARAAAAPERAPSAAPLMPGWDFDPDAPGDPSLYPTASAVARVMDAVAASSVRIARPLSEET